MSRSSARQGPAPIALFVYSRLDHTRRAIESLRANEEAAASDLVIFSDGARSPENEGQVAAVREYVRQVSGFRSCRVVERPTNLGLSRSIIGGVTAMLKESDRVIVLEDDLITSPHFLRYMNEGLEEYRDDDRVASIHAYVYPVDRTLPETFFLRGADCWGWATWRDRWDAFNPDGQALLDALRARHLLRAFDMNGGFANAAMLERQIGGLNDSWAIRWHASMFLRGGLTLYPGRSLVANIGTDSTGTHCGTTDIFDVVQSARPVEVGRIPVEESAAARAAFREFGRKNGLGVSLRRRIARAYRTLVGRS